MAEVCAPGYTGRKRGEVVRTRTTEHSCTIPHLIGGDRILILSLQEVIEIHRRLVGRIVASQANRASGQTAKRSTRQIVIVAKDGISGQVLVNIRIQNSELRILTVRDVRICRRRNKRLESKIETRSAFALVIHSQIGIAPHGLRKDIRCTTIVERGIDTMPCIGSTLHGRVPKVEVQW